MTHRNVLAVLFWVIAAFGWFLDTPTPHAHAQGVL
jgi:hypothetical protein